MTFIIGDQVIIYDHKRLAIHCQTGVIVKIWWRSRPHETGRWVYEVELPTGKRAQCRDYHLVKFSAVEKPIDSTEIGE